MNKRSIDKILFISRILNVPSYFTVVYVVNDSMRLDSIFTNE